MKSLRGLVTWALIPLAIVMQVVDMRRPLFGDNWLWSSYLVVFVLVGVCGTLVPRIPWRQTSRKTTVIAALFMGLLLYSVMSALVSGEPLISGSTDRPDVRVTVPLSYRLVPLLTSALSLWAAFSVIHAIPRQKLTNRLWWSAWALVISSFLAWPRAVLVHQSVRMATGMGGSAILHLVLLLCLGTFLGAAAQRFHRRWSLVGGALATVALLLTGSRAGVLSLVVLILLMAMWHTPRLSWRSAAISLGCAVGLGFLLLLVPTTRRILVLSDELRSQNLQTSLDVWTETVQRIVLGVGSGRVWPWYVFEARYFDVPWRGVIGSAEGPLLTNPHSLPLGVAVELGLVGLGLLTGIIVVFLRTASKRFKQSRSTAGRMTVEDGIVLAVVAGLVAFLFDHYLLKNFGVSFWWWVFVLGALESHGQKESDPPERCSPESSSTT